MSAKRLLEAHLAGDKARAAELAAALSDAELHAELGACAAPTDLVRAFFAAADASTPLGEQRRVLLVKQACALMDSARAFSARQAKACIAFLTGELDALSARSVAEVAMAILASHRATIRVEAEAKSHELLPKCLALLACTEVVTYADDAGRHTAHYAEFQDVAVHRLCEPRWPRAALLPMMNTLRELPLTDAQLRVVVGKALGGASDLELQALPALVYQLLLLAGRGCKLEVLGGLARHFEALEKKTRRAHPRGGDDEEEEEGPSGAGATSAGGLDDDALLGSQIRRADDAAADPETLAAVQNTVIVNIDLALRQDHGLGSTLLRMLKTHALQLSSFSLSLLLLLARQPRFEDEAVAWLTGAVRNAYNEAAWAFSSPWLAGALRPLRTCRVAPLLVRLTRPTGPEHLLPSIVLLSTAWMDAATAFGGGGGAPAKMAAADGGGGAGGGAAAADDAGAAGGGLGAAAADEDERAHALSSNSRLARLGANTLVEVFRGHSGSHGEILECILARVAARAPSCARWVQLLGRLARAVPTLLMHHVSRLRETLAYAAHLPPAVSVELLRALLPLSSHRAELRDAIVLSLRKAAFQRDESARLVAVRGFLLLLDGAERCAAAAAEPGALATDALDSEVLGFLKRCLTHQPSVRAALYAGLPPIFRNRPHLRAAIVELLAGQLSRYQEARSEIQPLDLHACLAHSSHAGVDGGAAAGVTAATAAAETEPLALLIRCLAACLHAEDAAGGAAKHAGARALLEDIRARMHVAGTADFGLDKSTDFSAAHAHGQANVAAARLLQSVLIALVEVEVHMEDDESALGRAISLHAMHTELTALLKGGGGGGKGGGAGGSKGAPKALKVAGAAPSTFSLALAPSMRILRLAVDAAKRGGAQAAGAASGAADEPEDEAARAADALHAPHGEPLLRCAVLSAQREHDLLEAAARTEAACTLVPLLLAEAELAVSRALGDGGADAESEKEGGGAKGKEGAGGKEGGAGGRPYGALLFDALDAVVKGTTDRPALVTVLRAALASGEACDGAGGDADDSSAADGGAADVAASSAAVVSKLLRARFEPMLARLLHAEGAHVGKEAEACLRLVRSLGARLSAENAGAHAAWALSMCCDVPSESCTTAAGRALVAHWLQLSSRVHNGSLRAALEVLHEAREHVGALPLDEAEESGVEALESLHGFQLMHEANALSLAQPAIERLDEVVAEIDKALVVLKRVMPAAKSGAGAGAAHKPSSAFLCAQSDAEEEDDELGADGESSPACELQRAILTRILDLEQPLLTLASCDLSAAYAEHALRTVEKFYRALTAAFALAPSASRQHRAIVEMHWQRLSRVMYALISSMASEMGVADRKRTKREARLVPALIFRVEQFEGMLVRLSKKLKVDLTSQMRRSTARDFRIVLNKIVEEEVEKENDEQPKKRKRTAKGKAAVGGGDDGADNLPEDVDNDDEDQDGE